MFEREKKRARREEEGKPGGESEHLPIEESDSDVRLCRGLQARMGGRRHVKESALSRAVLLSYLRDKGDVKRVTLVRVAVQEMGGRTFDVTVDETPCTVRALKLSISDQEGLKTWSQHLFRFEAVGGGSAAPLADSVVVSDEDQFALCVDNQDGGTWDSSSPLLSGDAKQFLLSGDGNSIATKTGGGNDFRNCLMTSLVLENGKHRISFMINKGDGMFFGLVQDGSAWNGDQMEQSEVWYMFSNAGGLYGRGKQDVDKAGSILKGDTLSLEADLDAGTLRFWKNGKPHGPGYGSGVTGRLRWAASMFDCRGLSVVQIVQTPELEPWKEWDGQYKRSTTDNEDGDY